MEIKRILVAINSPNARDAAFERALALARSSGAELYLLHAAPVDQRFSFRAAERLQRMNDMRLRAEHAAVRVQTVEQHGDAAEIIELHANARDVDLIVMGHEPRPGWRGRRSSIAERVVRRARVPILVVTSDGSDSPFPFEKILVAVDLSPLSNEVLQGAVAVTASEAVQLTVLHTVRGVEAADAFHGVAGWVVPEFRTHVIEDARRALEALVLPVPAAIDTRVQVSIGSATRAILDETADLDVDLVVVGRSRGFKILGSTALRVLRKNDRALLVVPGVDHTRGVEWQRAA